MKGGFEGEEGRRKRGEKEKEWRDEGGEKEKRGMV
jgi:hypothetical protein